MKKEEAIEKLNALAWVQGGPDREEMIEAISMAIEALSAEQKDEDLANDIARQMATIIENEQDMRVILKNASTELLNDGTLKVNVQNGAEVNRVLVWGDDGCGGLYYADDRPSGEWIKQSEDLKISDYRCSVCGYYHDDKTNYCEDCGAKMGGE